MPLTNSPTPSSTSFGTFGSKYARATFQSLSSPKKRTRSDEEAVNKKSKIDEDGSGLKDKINADDEKEVENTNDEIEKVEKEGDGANGDEDDDTGKDEVEQEEKEKEKENEEEEEEDDDDDDDEKDNKSDNADEESPKKQVSFGDLLGQKDEKKSDKEGVEEEEASKLNKQKTITGEEGEKTLFSAKAKLYLVDTTTKSWKERGIGTIHLNEPILSLQSDETATKKRSKRLVMRSDGVLRVIMNVPLFKGMNVQGGESPSQGDAAKGSMGNDKFVRIFAFEDGNPVQFAIKVGSPATARDLAASIRNALPKD